MKKILFITGTRADYGKMKSLLRLLQNNKNFEVEIFATGMHVLSQYGLTWKEIEKDRFRNIYQYINQQLGTEMDIILSNTIMGLSNYVIEKKPDLIVVHGDRIEALSGAIVGALNNIRVAHIEGGEVSGTIDESIRHAITKFAHIHFVCNEDAKRRVIQLGEKEESIFTIGSPDIDIMLSENLPSYNIVKNRYDISFDKQDYAIFMYHPVTTEYHLLEKNIKEIKDALVESEENFVMIYPNNDKGSAIIINEIEALKENNNIKIYPSIRFEYFLTLLKHAKYIIGNSSSGIREAEVYGIPTIDIGNRQMNRYSEQQKNIIHTIEDRHEILKAINEVNAFDRRYAQRFGKGNSDVEFLKVLEDNKIWNIEIQKNFNDLN
ncbi:UDP-N-acetylglucosamine 2-epimerase [Gracilibacillus suaedae]|uniref:UDP-N-acetylglucosamine 2-epimerase n=1 Tax=Gracilibacillus suaedae TaxID=2820273 RepID=UPI001ABDFD43|nr:UDP-N-acetylglucosamine 2-epimerase [Gracilibacillus suaedae]